MTKSGRLERVGGHAVVEGALLRTRYAMAIAVRRPSGEIVVRERSRPAPDRRGLLWGVHLPVLESLSAWAQALDFAAAQQGPLAAAAIGHAAPPQARSRRALRWRLMMYRGAVDQVLAAHHAGCPATLDAVRAHAAAQRQGRALPLRPGHWLQLVLTRPPTDDMVEVALVALRAVLARSEPAAVAPARELSFIGGRGLADACARQVCREA